MRKTLLVAVLLATPALAATGPTLAGISHLPTQIGVANVVDVNGRVVGTVQRVEVTPDGRPTEVAVLLQSDPDRLLVLNAGKVRYDAASNQVIADRSGAQLAALTEAR